MDWYINNNSLKNLINLNLNHL